jgi:hypothetical protein
VDEVKEDSHARAPGVRQTEPRRWMEPGKRDEAEEDEQSWGRWPLGFRHSTTAELLTHDYGSTADPDDGRSQGRQLSWGRTARQTAVEKKATRSRMKRMVAGG